jgi:hypothetical protein
MHELIKEYNILININPSDYLPNDSRSVEKWNEDVDKLEDEIESIDPGYFKRL